jgi:hypothetical protein
MGSILPTAVEDHEWLERHPAYNSCHIDDGGIERGTAPVRQHSG